MANSRNYQVFPDEPKPVQEVKYRLKDVKGIGEGTGCLVWGGIWVAVVSMIGYWYCGPTFNCGPKDDSLVAPISIFWGVLFASLATVTIHFILKWENVSKLENQHKYEGERNEKTRVEKEAASTTSDLRNIYESSTSLPAELTKHLRTASRWLRHAKREYDESAYSPFWDAVENAARHLAAYDEQVTLLSDNAESYYQGLLGRKHTFPSFPVQPEAMPDASPILEEFRRVVRLGLACPKDPTFAIIWEHYKDRKVMMAGFHYLGEAINNLGYAIEDSISTWQESISSDLAKSVEEGIKSREVLVGVGTKLDKRLVEQNRMLDNIQHDRKPKSKDSPSKR